MTLPHDPFSMSSMSNALQDLHCYPPPRFIPRASAQYLNWLFNLMTSSEGVAQFKGMLSYLNLRVLERMVLVLTSDLDYFLEIVKNKYGSIRVQKLLGISDHLDSLFSIAILNCFLQMMTDKYAYYVALRAMLVVQTVKKQTTYEYTFYYALDLARDQQGCIAFNQVITDIDDYYYRNQLLGLVACNALFLSNDASGNFVVQHALELNVLQCTHNITYNLHGHCVDLSFRKHGSYIVERLLEAEFTNVVVVQELLECEGARLMRLARNEYGNFVVSKALRVTQKMSRIDMFWGLVDKLKPFIHLLGRSRGSSNILNILESVI